MKDNRMKTEVSFTIWKCGMAATGKKKTILLKPGEKATICCRCMAPMKLEKKLEQGETPICPECKQGS